MTESYSKPVWARSARAKKEVERVAAGLKPRRQLFPWIVACIAMAGPVSFALMNPAAESLSPSGTEAQLVMQVRRAETIRIFPVAVHRTVRVTGTLAPSRQADVSALVSGKALSVVVRPGDAVEKGQVLVELDPEALNIQLNRDRQTAQATRAQLIAAEQQLKRTQELARQGLATPSALEHAQSAADVLRSNLAALEEAVKAAEFALDGATLRAPMSGIVSSRSVEPGQSVTGGSSLITIVNLDAIEYQASASVGSSALIEPGQPVTLTVNGLKNQALAGTVTRVNPVASSGTRTIPIFIDVQNPEQTLRGGMFASGIITVDEKPGVIAVPGQALREDAEGTYVLKLVDDVVVRQAVQPGESWDNGDVVEVAGLAAGDIIVAIPLTRLNPGDRFKWIEA